MIAIRMRASRSQRRLLIFLSLVSIGALVAMIGAESTRAAEPDVAGHWQGTLETGVVDLRIVFNIAKSPEGRLTATMDSPDQGAKGLPIETAALEGNVLTLEARRIGGTYQGTISADGRRIKGEWRQSGQTMALDLTRLEKEPDYRRPQDPTKPYPYEEREVTVENAAGGVKLAGTLTLPKAAGAVPAVVLLTGSGAQDRDESILGHKPFLVLADYLTRRGIAVLRLDDRGVGESTGSTSNSTTTDLAGDALAAVAYLKTVQQINPRRIGLVGHSDGGIVAPLAASRSSDVAFIVMLAGTGVPGEQIVLRQGAIIARAQKADEKLIASAQELQKKLFAVAKRDANLEEAKQEIIELMRESDSYKSAATAEAKAAVEAQVEAQAQMMFTPWFRSFLTYDPALALAKVHCPVLVLNGEKDLQVDPQQNLPPIAAALKQAGNRDVTIRELPGLNHLFQHCQTGSPVEYGKIDETFAPEALAEIADWILARAK
ncbi:MAG: alpha/beta fold hydrolase [Pirellulales bacterium]